MTEVHVVLEQLRQQCTPVLEDACLDLSVADREGTGGAGVRDQLLEQLARGREWTGDNGGLLLLRCAHRGASWAMDVEHP